MTTLSIDTPPRLCNKCGEGPAFASNGRCKQCSNQESRDYRIKNIEKVREADRLRHVRDRDKRLALMKQYHENNKEKRLETERKRYQVEAERIKARCAEYRASNKDKIYEWNGTRRAIMRNAMPVWASRAEIKDFYDCARALTKETGITYHVDHIIPLSNPNVCGLHIPQNLAVLRAADNMRKGNRIENA